MNVDEPSVLTFAQFHAGTRNNIIPDRAEMNGTLRTYDGARRVYMQRRVTAPVERMEVGPVGADIVLRVAGLASLVRELGAGAPEAGRAAV